MDVLIVVTAMLALTLAERVPSLRYLASPFLRPFFSTDVWYFVTGGVLLSYALRTQSVRWVGAPDGMLLDHAPFWLIVVLATVLYDLGAFVSHVLLHRVPALWELHKVHHSSRTLDWLAAFRAHILEHTLRHLLSPVVLVVLGFPLSAVAIASGIFAAWAAFGHANLRVMLRFLTPLFITPRLHRMHHVPRTSAHNFGTLLSVWDRMCGTLSTAPAAGPEPLGVPGEIATYPQRWLPQLVEPLRRIQ